MANQAAKKQKIANEEFLFQLLMGIAVVNLVYVGLNIPSIAYWGTFTLWDGIAWILALSFCVACYILLRLAAKCTFDESNKLVSAGEDLKKGGLLGYLFDMLCLVCFLQLASTFSRWAWILLLIVKLSPLHYQ
jgi:hypothetical protein